MMRPGWTVACLVIAALSAPRATARAQDTAPPAQPCQLLRVATFNLEDVRTDEIADRNNTRLRALAELIQRLRPNVIFLNEITYDIPGVLGSPADAPAGQNAQKFADTFLATPQSPELKPLHFKAFMAEVNTGITSGMDLDNNGKIATSYPTPAPALPDGTHPEPGADARDYGGDCWGFGTFPGQYGMALLVDERLAIVSEEVRTFRLMPWDFVPGALLPATDGAKPWFTPDEQAKVRLSSKSHWDIPVRLPNKAVVHFLCSHPTPPVFDGPEDRNGRRNHDEIRFWADYIENASYIVDDTNTPGGLDKRAHFVIIGDLNSDPVKGQSHKSPIKSSLLTSRRLQEDAVPSSDRQLPGLAADDTSSFKLRVDYILPSRTLGIVRSGVWRDPPTVGQPPTPATTSPSGWNCSSPTSSNPAATETPRRPMRGENGQILWIPLRDETAASAPARHFGADSSRGFSAGFSLGFFSGAAGLGCSAEGAPPVFDGSRTGPSTFVGGSLTTSPSLCTSMPAWITPSLPMFSGPTRILALPPPSIGTEISAVPSAPASTSWYCSFPLTVRCTKYRWYSLALPYTTPLSTTAPSPSHTPSRTPNLRRTAPALRSPLACCMRNSSMRSLRSGPGQSRPPTARSDASVSALRAPEVPRSPVSSMRLTRHLRSARSPGAPSPCHAKAVT